MKKLHLILLILIGSFTANAQTDITGIVKDTSNTPVAFSNVILKDISSEKIISGTTTNMQGEFEIRSTAGNYILELSFMGYKTLSKEIEVSSGNFELGTMILKPKANSLGEIIIKGEQPIFQQEPDRLTFNVENSIMATGGNMVDVLKVTPGLQVSDEGINLLGRGNMRAMINGHIVKLTGEDLVNFLNSIPAENISKIEVIDTPPSKYEAEGGGGLINIIYKKGVDGKWNTNLSGSYRQGFYALGNLGLNTIYNKDKLSFSANINVTKGSIRIIDKSQIFYPQNVWRTKNTRKDNSENINGRVALDYDYSKRSSIGFQYLGSMANPDKDYSGRTIISSNNQIDSLIVSDNPSENKNYNHSLNIHHETQLDTLGRSLSFDLDYFRYKDENNSPLLSTNILPNGEPTGSIISALNTSDQQIENFSAKFDLNLPFQFANISLGAKASFTVTDNFTDYTNRNDGTQITVPDQNNKFEYEENVQAVYANVQKSFGEKWSTVFGLRLENTQTLGNSTSLDGSFEQSNENSYLKLFPSAYISFNPNKLNALNLRYNRRISRPDFWELNPYKQYINAYIYTEGNPFLQPSFTHNIQLSHSYKNKLNSSVFINIVENGFGQFPGVDPATGEQFYTRDNYFKRTSYGLSESYNFKPVRWWRNYSQLFAFYHDVEFLSETNLQTPPLDGFGLRFSTFNTLTIDQDRNINAEVNFWYSPGTRFQIYESTGSSGLDLGLNWSPNEKIELSAVMSDIFNQNNPTYTTFTNNIKQEYNVKGGTRFLRLSVSYKFGNKEVKKDQREFGNEEELDRATKY